MKEKKTPARAPRPPRAAQSTGIVLSGTPHTATALQVAEARAEYEVYSRVDADDDTWSGLATGASSPAARLLASLSAAHPALQFPAAQILNAAATSALPIVAAPDWNNLHRRDLNINPDMDTRLQVALARQKSGVRRMPLASTAADDIAVIAKVNDVAAWEALSEVAVGVTLAGPGGGADDAIVTARIPVKRIEAVRRQPFVLSLKASQPVKPALAATVADMKLAPAHMPPASDAKGGAGVVVGIVDFGCDFTHSNLRKKDGSTRIEAIWDQAGGFSPGGEVKYGRLHRQGEIDAALKQANPYKALGYRSLQQASDFTTGTHGTHVTDIAAGNGRGSGTPGCAPEASIIFVEASANDIAWHGPDTVLQSFGDSVQMLEAVAFIFEQAGERPCVVNLSLGTNGGPHDGSTLLEQGIDRLIRAKPNRSVVIAASNAQADRIHTDGTIAAGSSFDVLWDTLYSAAGQEAEVWMPGASRVAVEVIAPDGTSLGVAEPGTNMAIGNPGKVSVFVGNRVDDPGNHDNVIGIFIAGTVGGGQWRLRLIDRAATDTPFHAWVERDDNAQTSFAQATDHFALGSISCGFETISVGSYDAHKPSRTLSYFSSHGPTRDGRSKPEVSAPGHAVMAARSATRNGVVAMSGTSMAAPAVTGLVALILAEATRLKIKLTSAQLRDVVIKGAILAPPFMAAGTWHPGYGHGRATSASLALLQQFVGSGAGQAPSDTAVTAAPAPAPGRRRLRGVKTPPA